MIMISVIMPAYNAEKTIEKAIYSVLNQSYPHFELIIINDGSTDNTPTICSRIIDKNREIHKIKLLTQENRGLSEARNTGIRIAKGDYLCFIDSDDQYQNNYLEALYHALEENGSDLVICGISNHNNNIEFSKISAPKQNCEKPLHNKEFLSLLETGLLNPAWNKLYKREIIISNKLSFKNIKLIEDLDFNIDYYSFCYKISIIPDSLYTYEHTYSTLTKASDLQYLDNYVNVHGKLLERSNIDSATYIHRAFYHHYLAFVIKVLNGEQNNKVIKKLKSKITHPFIHAAISEFHPNNIQERIIHLCFKRKLFILIYLYLKHTNS